MESKNNRATLTDWAERLRALGLGEVAALLCNAVRPLAPIGAGLLWIAQPALGMFVEKDRVGRLAGLLEDPDALARLGEQLAGEEPDSHE